MWIDNTFTRLLWKSSSLLVDSHVANKSCETFSRTLIWILTNGFDFSWLLLTFLSVGSGTAVSGFESQSCYHGYDWPVLRREKIYMLRSNMSQAVMDGCNEGDTERMLRAIRQFLILQLWGKKCNNKCFEYRDKSSANVEKCERFKVQYHWLRLTLNMIHILNELNAS